MLVKLMAYTSNHKKIFREEAIESLCGTTFEYLKELPFELGPGEVLFIELDEIDDELIEELKYTRLKFIFLVRSFQLQNLDRFLSLGGNQFVCMQLEVEDFIFQAMRCIHQNEIFKLSHLLSSTDLELFRFINRAGNGDKSKLTKLVFGSTSDGTMDVNLSRLRKKLRDPDIGDDFFRILTKDGRLYIVSRLTNYEIPKKLLITNKK